MNDRGNSGFPVGQNGGIEKVKANTLSRNCKTVYQRAKSAAASVPGYQCAGSGGRGHQHMSGCLHS